MTEYTVAIKVEITTETAEHWRELRASIAYDLGQQDAQTRTWAPEGIARRQRLIDAVNVIGDLIGEPRLELPELGASGA